MKDNKRGKAVLLVVSKSGIKVCSPKTKSVLMAHALRRISYATCDLAHRNFSFLARQPKGHLGLQYCHVFATDTPQQAEELSRLVGEAFRMAFAQQLQQTSSFLVCHQSEHHSPVRLQDRHPLIERPSSSASNPGRSEPSCSPGPSGIQSAHGSPTVKWRSPIAQDDQTIFINTVPQSPARGTINVATERVWAKTATTKHHDPLVDRGRVQPSSPQRLSPPTSLPTGAVGATSDLWSPCSTSSCEDNTSERTREVVTSPTEVNSQFREKPQLVKTFESSWTTVKEERSPTEVEIELVRPGSGGYINESRSEDAELESKLRLLHRTQVTLPPSPCSPPMSPGRLAESPSLDSPLGSKRSSQSSESTASLTSEDMGHVSGKRHSNASSVVTPPPIPERHDSLGSQDEEEERELREAPWFQAGIPREIALEILAQEPVGSFMVRESTSKPGCYALSLRVPRDFQPAGIAHYLIMRTQRGFKIKGFMKEFSTLTALITHHSVMPELLPCPLSLSRHNPVFRKQDTSEDLVDIEDPDYNLIADFRKVMADMKA